MTMAEKNERRPAGNGTAPEQVGETRSRVTRSRSTRRPADRVTTIDYEGMGFTLGYAERAAIGSALLVLERAA